MINDVVLLLLCLCAVIQDIKMRKVKNAFNVASAVIAFMCVLITDEVSLKSALPGLVSAFFLGILLWKLGAFMAGDAKFMWSIGILKGFEGFWLTMIISIFAGAFFGILLMIKNRDFIKRMKRLWNYFSTMFITRKYTKYVPENPKEMPFTLSFMAGCILECFVSGLL